MERSRSIAGVQQQDTTVPGTLYADGKHVQRKYRMRANEAIVNTCYTKASFGNGLSLVRLGWCEASAARSREEEECLNFHGSQKRRSYYRVPRKFRRDGGTCPSPEKKRFPYFRRSKILRIYVFSPWPYCPHAMP